MKDLYFVDGYNVIFWSPETFDRTNLEMARKDLVDLLQDYGAHNNIEMVVVFDGQGKSTKVKEEPISDSFTIVFTPKRMTADSYIEKESYRRKDEYRSIYVVTSDGPEQNQVLGNGAYRMAASELLRVIREDKTMQSMVIAKNNQGNLRNEIGRAIPETVQEKLNKLRGMKREK